MNKFFAQLTAAYPTIQDPFVVSLSNHTNVSFPIRTLRCGMGHALLRANGRNVQPQEQTKRTPRRQCGRLHSKFQYTLLTLLIITLSTIAAERPIIIIAPTKAGNHLLSAAISEFTGKKVCWPGYLQGNELDAAIGEMDCAHRLMHLHIAYTQANIDAIAHHNPILFYIYRDPRDVCVSFTYFRINWMGLDGKPRNDFAPLLTEIITTLIVPWYAEATPLSGIAGMYDAIMPWTTYPDICVIRYEDLIGEKGGGSATKQYEALARIARHLGIAYDDTLITNVATNFWGNSVTFRKGLIGSWKSHFTPKDVELFKQAMGQWLITWGYEKDLNWE